MAIRYNSQIVKDGLVLHLDAANPKSYPGSGTSWYDLSGNNKNFTWVSSPTFTAGAIPYFSTLNNRCTGPASNSFGIDNTSGYTIFMHCMQNALVNTAAFKFYSTVTYNRGIFAHCTWGDDVIYFDQGSCCGSDTRLSASSGGSQSWNLWTFRRTLSTERSIWKNGKSLTSTSVAPANISLNSTAVDVGSTDEYGGNASTWNARLATFIVYNRGLTDSEILQNANALKSRFGLT
jgi:hypothetical protein